MSRRGRGRLAAIECEIEIIESRFPPGRRSEGIAGYLDALRRERAALAEAEAERERADRVVGPADQS